MIILAIESSCDETAASVVEDGTKVLSHVLATSARLHAKTGGIIPEMAAREQVKSIIPVIKKAIENSKLGIENLDCIAITYGPGLIGSLLVGVETAKTLAYTWNKPLVPVNHLLGHIYANWLEPTYVTASGSKQSREIASSSTTPRNDGNKPQFPALALVVSGGHTDLVFMENHGKIEWIGGTRDDAAGEAFDKTARLLGLKYPGGPAIAAEAAKFQAPGNKLQLFPRPLINEDTFDWSFSGLKTAVSREVQKRKIYPVIASGAKQSQDRHVASAPRDDVPWLAAEIQEAIVDVLTEKTLRAVKKFKPKSLLLGGGVAANQRLRERLTFEIGNLKLEIGLFIAPPKYCTDNASMIAAAAYYNYKEIPWEKVTAVPSLTILGET